MTPFERRVRSRIYELFVEEVRTVDAQMLARSAGWAEEEVSRALQSLAAELRIAMTEEGCVRMAHPFSGVPTPYRAVIGDHYWQANCAWDALAILSLLGDGEACGPDGLVWTVSGGLVEPNGIVHLLVPARSFWEDVGFT